MDKSESLAFLQSCIDNIDATTPAQIAIFQELYKMNCVKPILEESVEYNGLNLGTSGPGYISYEIK